MPAMGVQKVYRSLRYPLLTWIICTAAVLSGCADQPDPATGSAAVMGSAEFVGTPVCADCHQDVVDAWQGSDHERAMQPMSPDSVLADFDGTTFIHQGVTTRFEQRGEQYVVTTDGPDGQPTEFKARYAFGVDPLQQYLLEMPNGNLQTLGVSWDSRPASMACWISSRSSRPTSEPRGTYRSRWVPCTWLERAEKRKMDETRKAWRPEIHRKKSGIRRARHNQGK